ncbi:MAG: tetratricopeptide repeat protein [Bacteroidales bacterium]|nr:tetratricopeptide repeat protein [Bacteroidales bacterium]MBN2820152.1 tetratricopeptide repeat protein [Bacteroidales bacterium]
MRGLALILVVTMGVISFAQSPGKSVRQGNVYYKTDKYTEAEIKYREAIDNNPQMSQANYNLGNAKYRQDNYESAVLDYQNAISSTKDPNRLSKYYYNLGNAFYNQQKLKESVEAYKNALRNNPDNENARHNLFLAEQMLKQQQQQQQQQNQDSKPQEPSEFAKKLKKQAQELVNQRRYSEAYNLMVEGEKKDPTVAYFKDFTNKINEVDQINKM